MVNDLSVLADGRQSDNIRYVKHKRNLNFLDNLQGWTENLLTIRARRLEKKRRRHRRRGNLLEWIDAFLWAVAVVLLLNQYLLQAYQIPSGSMRNTLIGGRDPYSGEISKSDRIFVDKVIFGPELLPGLGKLPGFRESRRGEVIIFENPEYESPSLFHEIAQRVLYMVSISLVDLNRIRGGSTAHQFLIKRQVAMDGDRVLFRRGVLYIQPKGWPVPMEEENFKELTDQKYANHLLLDEGYYSKLDATVRMIYMERAGLTADRRLADRAAVDWVSPLRKTMLDQYEMERLEFDVYQTLFPYDEEVGYACAAYERGIYVPENWLLPLGDNRSDSMDGRYFGPVSSRKILGRALFIYWPPVRIRGIR